MEHMELILPVFSAAAAVVLAMGLMKLKDVLLQYSDSLIRRASGN